MFLLGWLFLCLASVGLLAVYLGVYREREHLDRHIFLKHRPALTWTFWSPVGESDKRLNDLTAKEQAAELLYKEYVEAGGGYRRSFPLPSRPGTLAEPGVKSSDVRGEILPRERKSPPPRSKG